MGRDASETGESTKCPWVGVLIPPPLPKGILFSPQETKMAARSNWTIDTYVPFASSPLNSVAPNEKKTSGTQGNIYDLTEK